METSLRVLLLVLGMWVSVQETDQTRRICDFEDSDESTQWRIVNDGVMGGLSESSFRMTGQGTAVFEGKLSLENSGGFASVRTFSTGFSLNGFTGFRIRVRGDGKVYHMRARTDDRLDGVSYDLSFATRQGNWEELDLPFESFSAQYRGRKIADAPQLDPGRIRQVGLLISDRQEGDFRLEVDWMDAYRE